MPDEELALESADQGESTEAPDVESGDKSKTKKSKDAWDKLQAFAPLFTGIVLALVGYFLTGSVNEAVQKNQLDFNYVKEMQELVAKMGDGKATLEETKSTAVALAAFGVHAIPPLLNEIQSGELNRPAAGEYGLRALALADPKNACPPLALVLENRTAAYNWLTHRAAIRILGVSDCQHAQPVLARYQQRLNAASSSTEGFAKYQATVAGEPTITRETVDQLKMELGKTFTLLQQGGAQQ